MAPAPGKPRLAPTGGAAPPRRARRPLAPLVSLVAVVLSVAIVAVGLLGATRLVGFVDTVTGGFGIGAPPGSVAWKLQHGQRVNLLLLGYGGSENDAPYLTDTILAVTLDPNSDRVVEVSIPRDLYGQIDAWPKSQTAYYGYQDKINAAFMVGTDRSGWGQKLPAYTGRNGGGHLAETEVGKYTGIHFDGYAALDFKAFRDLVNALGGVDVCLSSPLDDYQYPNYAHGFIRGGIHFKAGCQRLNGERALELARSRHAVEPAQATDFGRARRQQLLLSAIRKQALSVNGVVKAPALMAALQGEFKTDLTLNDLHALYDFGSRVPESRFEHLALTDQNLLVPGACGPAYLYTLCPVDPSLQSLHQYFASDLLPESVLSERAPIVIDDATYSPTDLSYRLSALVAPLGLRVGTPVRTGPAATTVIYDFSQGRDPQTAAWLARYFGAPVRPGPAALAGYTRGLLVVVGHDYGLRWYGLVQ